MDKASSSTGTSIASRLIKLPFQGVWFLVKHPVVAVIMTLTIAYSAFTSLAHFNPAIAARFNSAVGYFGASILLHESADIIRKYQKRVTALEADLKTKKSAIDRKNKALRRSASALMNSSLVHQESAAKLKKQADSIQRKNAALKEASNQLSKASDAIRFRDTEIARKKALLNANEERLKRFKAQGLSVEEIAKRRFSKVALYDTAGEFLGWIPLAGDAVSMGLAATGLYEMCQMMREIEHATDELGVRFNIYTDTFCEKPAEQSIEVITEKAGQIKKNLSATMVVLQDKAAKVSTSTFDRVTASIDSAFEILRNMI